MGILADALSIFIGVCVGNIFKGKILFKNFMPLSIGIMIVSMVGFFENVFNVRNAELESTGLMIVVFSLIIGIWIGEAIHIDDKLNSLTKEKHGEFIDAVLFFGVGGLQISGPVLLAVSGDNSQLILKSMIDFPFAVVFGMTYGKITAFSALPVAVMQLIIVFLAKMFSVFFSDFLIAQLCAMGYIVLFFSGFNMICASSNKINNNNMLPGIVIVIILNLIFSVWGIRI